MSGQEEKCYVCGRGVDPNEQVVWVHGPWTVSAEVIMEAMVRGEGSLPTPGSLEEECAVLLATVAGIDHDGDHEATVRGGAALRDLGFEVWDGHRHCWDLDAYRCRPT
jgi:hypothetical protein